jgi:septal ring factor EnvC (AmiA/AmiB activator)
MTENFAKESRLRFSLKSLILLTGAVCVFFGGRATRAPRIRECEQQLAELKTELHEVTRELVTARVEATQLKGELQDAEVAIDSLQEKPPYVRHAPIWLGSPDAWQQFRTQ